MSPVRMVVDAQFKNSNVGAGMVFFLLPFILLIALLSLIGSPIDFANLVISIVRELVYWILASVLMFVLLIVFKGNAVKGKFKSILASFSVTYLITFVAAVLMNLVVFISIPGFFQKLSSLVGRDVTFDQMVSVMSSLALPSIEVQVIIILVLLAIALGAFLGVLHVIYRIGTLVKETTGFSNLVFLVIFIGLSFILNQLIILVFGFI